MTLKSIQIFIMDVTGILLFCSSPKGLVLIVVLLRASQFYSLSIEGEKYLPLPTLQLSEFLYAFYFPPSLLIIN